MATHEQPTRVVDGAVVDTLARLQQLAATLGATDALDSLPQIVVLGSQSAGKSSTIESLVGLSFLTERHRYRDALPFALTFAAEGHGTGGLWGVRARGRRPDQ